MKKLFATVLAAAALALPVSPAAASDIPPPAGTKRCPAPYTHGFILWVNTGPTGYQERWFCIARGPESSADETSSARAGITRCGSSTHFIVWYYDLNNEYRELWNSCIL